MDSVELHLPVSAKLKSQKIMGKRILGENYYTGKDEQESDNTPKQNDFLYFKCHNFPRKLKPRDKAQAKKIWNILAFSFPFGSLLPLVQSKQQNVIYHNNV